VIAKPTLAAMATIYEVFGSCVEEIDILVGMEN
jgi:hypothetical protein